MRIIRVKNRFELGVSDPLQAELALLQAEVRQVRVLQEWDLKLVLDLSQALRWEKLLFLV